MQFALSAPHFPCAEALTPKNTIKVVRTTTTIFFIAIDFLFFIRTCVSGTRCRGG